MLASRIDSKRAVLSSSSDCNASEDGDDDVDVDGDGDGDVNRDGDGGSTLDPVCTLGVAARNEGGYRGCESESERSLTRLKNGEEEDSNWDWKKLPKRNLILVFIPSEMVRFKSTRRP